ncbi:hypothetical protein SORBI_3002G229200 [Sorghum bicolor]|uniref:DUF7597 domain-containing protein n=1 Tax=Sorghum bicolor TaxID=4558 RepID=A0A1B6QCZ7_SORBI|nr:hypothetical protein SORBI_3002G229200 [Sorghum bicolor]
MVVAFGRCKFHLSEVSVSSILQATIGGQAALFCVEQLAPRVFKFRVGSKPVGIFIGRSFSFECDLFKLFFHLWGAGGPNWQKELALYLNEEESSWSAVKRVSQTSFADVVKSSLLSGANSIPLGRKVFPPPSDHKKVPPARISVFGRIKFPNNSAFDHILSSRDERTSVRAPSVPAMPNSGLNQAWCSRCLDVSHSRNSCRNRITCFVCLGWGHEAGAISCSLSLGGAPSNSPPNAYKEPSLVHQQNPSSLQNPSSYPSLVLFTSIVSPPLAIDSSAAHPGRLSEEFTMAYQRANPALFIPNGMHRLNVPGRVPMVRAVARSRPQRRNETVAIVTINPLPGNILHFPNVREVLEEFFEERNIAITDIQPSHLGQAIVCFNSPVDRDALVVNSPMPMGDVQVSFVRHNQGRNWRRTQFNHECWLLLMGFPLDYWETEYIQDAICSFGRLENWVNNRRKLTALLVRGRVADLQSIPQWIVYSDGVGNDLDSWTVQVEIVSHDFVGGGPPPEEPAPQHFDHLAPFDFFGYGQPGAGPIHAAINPVNAGQQIAGQQNALAGQQNANAGQQNIQHLNGQQNFQPQEIEQVGQQNEQMAEQDVLGLEMDPQIEDEADQENEENPNEEWDILAAQNAPLIAWVSAQWAPFFTALLLSPANFKWAKSFTESEAWAFFSKSLDVVPIIIPTRKGNEGKNRKSKQPLVETEVRRSPRLKARNKGFKPNTCFSKKCLACLATPPDLSIELIKDIGVNLCQVDEHLLTDISLSKKRIS